MGAADELANHMGLFLQKTNIIRDYLEDIEELPAPRMFWPREVWGKHAEALSDFTRAGKAEDAVACLNELIVDALQHGPRCLEYMGRLQDPAVFRFCAIPQARARDQGGAEGGLGGRRRRGDTLQTDADA